jgi:cell division protein FtsL
MTPASALAAARKATATRPQREARPAPKSAPLKVVPNDPPARGRRRLVRFAPVMVVVVALVAVVVGQTLLANGQVRLTGIAQKVEQAQAAHRQLELQVSGLEMPSRIVSTAVGPLHMVHPAQLQQLPYVSLLTPLATPHVTPLPVAPATTGGATTGTTTTGSPTSSSATSPTTASTTTGTTPSQ